MLFRRVLRNEVTPSGTPWILAGLGVACVIEPLFDPRWFSAAPPIVWVGVAALAGLPAYISAGAATPVVAVLLHKGLPPGAALAFVLTAPLPTAALLSLRGARGLLMAVGGAVLALLAGVALDAVVLIRPFPLHQVAETAAGPVGDACLMAPVARHPSPRTSPLHRAGLPPSLICPVGRARPDPPLDLCLIEPRPDEPARHFMVIMPQAMGCPEFPDGCEARSSVPSWMITARLTTDVAPSPRVIPGAVTTWCALPSAAAWVFPKSPACCGWGAPVGLKCSPALAANSPPQSPFSWTWKAWVPGESPDRSSSIVTGPSPVCLMVTLPSAVSPASGLTSADAPRSFPAGPDFWAPPQATNSKKIAFLT
jgi:hypothetical protein